MTPLIKIGSFNVPEPSTYASTTSTIVDSARNVQGVVVGSVIREDVAKIECTWKFISAENWADIMAQFSSKRGGRFYNAVTFFNQDTNSWDTRNMYVSDRTSSVFLRRGDGSIRGYLGARLALIEV